MFLQNDIIIGAIIGTSVGSLILIVSYLERLNAKADALINLLDEINNKIKDEDSDDLDI